ncbi:hypothetical protein [Mucilaginibacter terrae]|uniref:CHASE2 domain-containing protein n=1 Tax=Mucilaginibacter terrae TaxID=1955052 RepID=A0ABU3GS44_9SPHI|nr:hypothetical protein [Mucilaginibacter terrae]MDT3402291.1 hypothetical protein [Mucilaginibacter terrae]
MTDINSIQKFLLLLVCVMIMSALVWVIVRKPLTLKRQLIVASIMSGLLTAYTITFLVGHSLFFEEEGIISGKLAKLTEWFDDHTSSNAQLSKQQDFVEKSFVFINTSKTVSLIPETLEDSTYMVVTNREQLTELFNFLVKHAENIGLVACDLQFSSPTNQDSKLAQSLLALQRNDKLVIANYEGLTEQNPDIYRYIKTGSLGEVTKVADEPIYYSHKIYNKSTRRFSLPYLMYAKLNHTKLLQEQDKNVIFKNFITELNFTDQDKLYRSIDTSMALQTSHERHKLTESSLNTFELGNATTMIGKDQLLRTIKAHNQKPIVYIGNLSDKYQDIHQTAAGPLLGSTIILNEFYYIAMGYHKMTFLTYGGFLIFLFAGFFIIIFVILKRAILEESRSGHGVQSGENPIISWWSAVQDFLLDDLFFVLMVVFVLVLDLCFHKVINIIGLIYVIPLFNALLRCFLKYRP